MDEQMARQKDIYGLKDRSINKTWVDRNRTCEGMQGNFFSESCDKEGRIHDCRSNKIRVQHDRPKVRQSDY